MKDISENITKELKRIDSLTWILTPIFIGLIILSPYIFTRYLDLNYLVEKPNIGSNIGGITAPLIGIISAVLVYFSFRAQIKANKIQIDAIISEREKNRMNEDLQFIYYRLTEIQSFNNESFKEKIKSLERSINEFNNELKQSNKGADKINSKTISFFNERNYDFVNLIRYLNLYSVIKTKLSDIRGMIDKTQKDYILSVLRYEYLSISGNLMQILISKILSIKETDIKIDKSQFEKIIYLHNHIQDLIEK